MMLQFPIVRPSFGASPSYTGTELNFNCAANGPAEPTADPGRVTVYFYAPKGPPTSKRGDDDDDTKQIERPFVALVKEISNAMGGKAGGVTVRQLTNKSNSQNERRRRLRDPRTHFCRPRRVRLRPGWKEG